MRHMQVLSKSVTKDFVEIKEDLAYIRTSLDELKERAKEDRSLTLAHLEDDKLQFAAIDKRLSYWSGALGIVVFILTTGLAAASLFLP